ncbi:MAG TPA: hypothetical protein VHN80_06170 [Kineosporiaceae bacterium]|jgi:hypothetical protein|nr:hypothetical protein [Kineosporiaceae bacterium]
MPDAKHDQRMRGAVEAGQAQQHRREKSKKPHRIRFTFHHRRPLHGNHA